jgi:hypothetical protein
MYLGKQVPLAACMPTCQPPCLQNMTPLTNFAKSTVCPVLYSMPPAAQASLTTSLLPVLASNELIKHICVSQQPVIRGAGSCKSEQTRQGDRHMNLHTKSEIGDGTEC